MTEYELKITRRTVNPDFDQQMQSYRARHGYGNYGNEADMPQRFIHENSLTVTISEETFAAIRKAAVETL